MNGDRQSLYNCRYYDGCLENGLPELVDVAHRDNKEENIPHLRI